LCADENHIRAQSAILDKSKPKPLSLLLHNRVFGTDGFYPYQKHGWRAQRASALAICDGR